ncbi:MAG: hypothetical protein H0U52_03410 [Chloroflexi bacterium]|nr:hypothetical protein [Chloroflexota bacterium]
MAPDNAVAPHGPIRIFLAERYGAGTSATTARQETRAAEDVAMELSREGRPVTLLGSLLVPIDETVFSLFEAVSAADVAAVGERTEQPYDRISEGIRVRR